MLSDLLGQQLPELGRRAKIDSCGNRSAPDALRRSKGIVPHFKKLLFSRRRGTGADE
jgi:hypothetical protein